MKGPSMQLYPTSWRGFIWASVRIAIGFYALLLGLLYFAQERLIFHPTKLPTDFKFQFGLPFEERVLEVDGLKIHSLLFKPVAARGLILYFHGNAGSLDGWGDMAEELASKTSMSVWIIDYPGFGKSEGSIQSEEQLHQIAREFMNAAKAEMGGSAERIVIYGRSIGAGLAVKIAKELTPAALILETPYMSLASLARSIFPWVPTTLLRYKLPADQWIRDVQSPIFIVHGDHDEVITYQQGKQLAELSHANLTTIVGGHHNDLGRYQEYWDFVARAIKSLHL